MAALYRVVEKTFSIGRERFHMVGGLWRDRLEAARDDSRRLASVSLAHRMFIVSPAKGEDHYLEEVELEPLTVRMERIHAGVLSRVNPGRLAQEKVTQEERAARVRKWQSLVGL